MDRSERLYENYEDAAFALLMDRVVREEGARLLEENERLQNDPEAAVPEEIDRACRKTIRRACARQRRPARRTAGWVLSRVAVAVLILLMLFATAYAASPGFRVGALDLLIRISNVSSELKLTTPGAEDTESEDGTRMLMGYALPPLGKTVTVIDEGENRYEGWIAFLRPNGATIRVRIIKGSDLSYNSEDTVENSEIAVNGYAGLLTATDNRVYISWYDSDQDNIIDLICSDIDERFALSFAEEIVFVG